MVFVGEGMRVLCVERQCGCECGSGVPYSEDKVVRQTGRL